MRKNKLVPKHKSTELMLTFANVQDIDIDLIIIFLLYIL
jgi:hypothetical protein